MQSIGAIAIVLLVASSSDAQTCLHKGDESTTQRMRRDTATRYLQALHGAQVRIHAQEGRFVPLAELPGLPSVPVGFVPRFLHERWSFVITLKDFFDPCGSALVLDELGVIYEAHPSMARPVTTTGAKE